MGSLILALLPLAAAMAVNPVPIIGVIAMLSTDKPLRNGALYVTTMVFVVAGIGVVSLLLLNDALGAAGSSGSSGCCRCSLGSPSCRWPSCSGGQSPPRGRRSASPAG